MAVDLPQEECRGGGKETAQYPDGADRSSQDAFYFLFLSKIRGTCAGRRRGQVGCRARRAHEQAQSLGGGN